MKIYILDINTEYVHSVFTQGVAVVCTPDLSHSKCPIGFFWVFGLASSFTFSAICPSPPGVSL